MERVDNSDSLLSALVQCFGVILIGYITGKFWKITTTEIKGLNNFVQYFSLPALIFTSLVKLDFNNVDWAFMASIFVSKVAVFILVATITMIITKPVDIGKAGLYAILATQSNDFALGYPLLLAVYSQSHPDYAHYVYILAPIQLVILNPIGFLLIEIHRQDSKRKCIFLSIIIGILTNPVVVMTIFGILANYIFHQHLPNALFKLLDVLGSAYSATALFLLGHSLIGKVGQVKGRTLFCPVVLILAKVLLLPLIIKKVIMELSNYGLSTKEKNELSDFGFLYGTFPFAPAAFIYATHYGMPTEIVSTGMVMCTIFSAPFMAISASVMSLHETSLRLLHSDLLPTKLYSSIVTLVLCLWIAVSFIIRKKWKTVTHRATLFLLSAQLILAIEGILSSSQIASEYCLKFLYIIGISAVRVWTVILAVTLIFLHWRSLCFVIRLNFILTAIGILLPITTVAIIAFSCSLNKVEDPIFEYGRVEAYIILIFTIISLIITTICLIIQQRRLNHQADYEPLMSSNDSEHQDHITNHEKICPGTSTDIEDLCYQNINTHSISYNLLCDAHHNCSVEQRKVCSSIVQNYEDSNIGDIEAQIFDDNSNNDIYDIHDVSHHMVLILLLCVSMVISIAICMWVLIMTTSTGIIIELQFLDVLLVYGQGLLIFFVFELDFKFVINFCSKLYRKCCPNNKDSLLPGTQDLKKSTHSICQQFISSHLKRTETLLRDESNRQNNSELFFSGKEFVDCLMMTSLVKNRTEAEQYSKQLLLGHVIRHMGSECDFHDKCLYKFV